MESIFAQEAVHNIVKDELGEKVRAKFEIFLQALEEQRFKGPVSPSPDSSKSQVESDKSQANSETEGPAENKDNAKYLYLIKKLREEDKTTLYIDFQDVIAFDPELAEAIELQAFRLEPYLRRGLQNVVKKRFPTFIADERSPGDKEFCVAFYNHNAIYKIRDLKTDKIGRLSSIRGTVTRTTEVRPELLYGSFQCMDCRVTATDIEQQFKYTEPVICKNPTCQNKSRWQLIVESSKFVDWQKVRVQENSDEIPSGSMPRSLDIILRHEEVEKAKAGDKCIFTGTLIVVPDISRGRLPGPKSQGVSRSLARPQGNNSKGGNNNDTTTTSINSVKDFTYKLCFLAYSVQSAEAKYGGSNKHVTEGENDEFTDEEIAELKKMKNSPKIYSKLVNSIAPAVFGHKEVKKGILLMLFGGVHKVTMEGINLRGDINVCIVGDPSTSKSQFLKYVVSFLPRAVYTSGKASSAAGLTATVVKDPDTGEFNIEAGALMLADNGICCIDEFDKMDTRDQVAIHEAMEQQTISIAKAGIHATLNARTSILAAANPVGGRYDKTKTLKANLNITPAIMSRFDLFFIILDECDEQTDYNIAKHIVLIHQRRDAAITPEYSTAQLQRYIRYAKSLKPTISPEASKLLVENYRKLRQSDIVGHNKTAYRITVRQLESMIRLSEALARVHCDPIIRPEYVTEAASLLKKSIIHVETGDVIFELANPIHTEEDSDSDNDDPAVNKKSTKTATKQQDKPKEKVQVSITFEKYEQISRMILLHLLRDSPNGESQKDIVNWYLNQKTEMNEIGTEAELENETRLINHIIGRLVSKEKTLVILQESKNSKLEDRVLVLNPNIEV